MASLNVQLKNKNGDLLYPKIKTSNLENDANFITSTDLNTAIAGINKLVREIVEVLPTEDISTNTIYLLEKDASDSSNVAGNIYNEFMYINSTWELIGTTEVNIENFYTKSEVDALLADKADSNDVYTKTEADNLLSAKAPLASPALTGTPTCPSPTTSTGIANKDYVDNAVSSATGTILYDVLT